MTVGHLNQTLFLGTAKLIFLRGWLKMMLKNENNESRNMLSLAIKWQVYHQEWNYMNK
jgi:hypothetical protein